MIDLRTHATSRLELRAVVPSDAAELFPILSDPAGWWYEPTGRHIEPAKTIAFVERAADRWETDGLSYWTVRKRDDPTVIGIGGAQRHRSGAWNLSYRIAVGEQGQGFGADLATAGIDAAHHQDERSAVIAWILEHNEPSRRIAERAGLVNYGLRIDANDNVERLAYADRPL